STHLERKEQYGHPLYRPAVDPDEEAKFALVRPGINLDIFDANRVGPEDTAIGEKIEAAIRRDIAPRRWHLPCVIASSRLEAKKNHLGLLRAWAVDERLRHAANLLLVVRGCDQPLIEWRKKLTGTEREVFGRLMQEILTHHLSGMVCAFELGTQQALAAAYRYLAAQKQGVFALTAFYEPFGLAPLEALAAGLPAVVTRNGGPAETLRNDQGQPIVLLVDPENPKDIASALVQLTTCSEVWEKFRRLGREHVLSHYSWEATARGYLAVCEQILAGRTAARTDYPIPAFFENPTEPEAQIPVDWISHYVQAAASKSHGPGGKTERGA
ncbi:MAG: glycosyltransferase, partial [Calditrichaeota bacterium]